MGDPSASDCSWKKMVLAKTNNEWISTIKKEQVDILDDGDDLDSTNTEHFDNEQSGDQNNEESVMLQEVDPLLVIAKTRRKVSEHKGETSAERKARLAKMSAYAAQRLANETPEQRAIRLRRMSQYAARRLAQETHEQRAKRLARMSAYAAKRLAEETSEQRQARLARMSAYAARRKQPSKVE